MLDYGKDSSTFKVLVHINSLIQKSRLLTELEKIGQGYSSVVQHIPWAQSPAQTPTPHTHKMLLNSVHLAPEPPSSCSGTHCFSSVQVTSIIPVYDGRVPHLHYLVKVLLWMPGLLYPTCYRNLLGTLYVNQRHHLLPQMPQRGIYAFELVGKLLLSTSELSVFHSTCF